MPVVTIRGQLGSGAPEIGRLVAERIGADYVDREILARVAERVQREPREILAKEMPPGTRLGRIAQAILGAAERGAGYRSIALPTWEMPLGDAEYIRALVEVIGELAEIPSIVIRGRGSQFILKDHPRAFHVLTVAPLPTRVGRVAASLKVDRRQARREISRFDRSRRAFIRHYFRADLEDPIHHDLVINTEHLSFEAASQLIVNALAMHNWGGEAVQR